jgi:hypothetical protein
LRGRASLAAAGGRATGLPWPIVVLVLAVVIGITMYRAQRWLRRRTHRMVNYGGPGTLLADAATSSRGEPGARWAATAGCGRGIGRRLGEYR